MSLKVFEICSFS